MKEIKLITYVEDNELYIDLVGAAVELADDYYEFKYHKFSDDAEKEYLKIKDTADKPYIVFVDINLVGSTYDGISLIRKINFEWGNDIIIGVLSSSSDEEEKARAKKAGALFWINKTSPIMEVIPEFLRDVEKFEKRELFWKEY